MPHVIRLTRSGKHKGRQCKGAMSSCPLALVGLSCWSRDVAGLVISFLSLSQLPSPLPHYPLSNSPTLLNDPTYSSGGACLCFPDPGVWRNRTLILKLENFEYLPGTGSSLGGSRDLGLSLGRLSSFESHHQRPCQLPVVPLPRILMSAREPCKGSLTMLSRS